MRRAQLTHVVFMRYVAAGDGWPEEELRGNQEAASYRRAGSGGLSAAVSI
jgi:hypothetical protein